MIREGSTYVPGPVKAAVADAYPLLCRISEALAEYNLPRPGEQFSVVLGAHTMVMESPYPSRDVPAGIAFSWED